MIKLLFIYAVEASMCSISCAGPFGTPRFIWVIGIILFLETLDAEANQTTTTVMHYTAVYVM